MGWFDSQIRERISNNKQQLQKAYWNLASVVMKETNETFADTQSTGNQNALTQICRYFHLQVNTVPEYCGFGRTDGISVSFKRNHEKTY